MYKNITKNGSDRLKCFFPELTFVRFFCGTKKICNTNFLIFFQHLYSAGKHSHCKYLLDWESFLYISQNCGVRVGFSFSFLFFCVCKGLEYCAGKRNYKYYWRQKVEPGKGNLTKFRIHFYTSSQQPGMLFVTTVSKWRRHSHSVKKFTMKLWS